MNTAEIYQFPVPEPGQQEQRVADTDDGYTRLANELLEELIGANLTRNQAKVAFAVCRKTYGFNKKMDWISGDQLSKLTNLPRSKCSTAKNELISMKVLVTEGRKVGINKYISDWEIDAPRQKRSYGGTKNKAGFIYVFGVSQNGPVKIGFTERSPKERGSELNTDGYFGYGVKASILFQSKFLLNAGKIEMEIHQRLSGVVVKGELFNISLADAIDVISTVSDSVPPVVTESVPPVVTSNLPTVEHTKDTITKDKKESITPIVPTGDVCEKSLEQCEEKPAEQPASQAIKTVFSHWQSEHNHLTSKLDPKRRKRINARLEEGFTVADLCKAISGAKYDTWLMGKNPSNKRYDGIETLLRDAAQVEKLRDLDDNEHAKAIAVGKYSATTARNLDRLQRWAGEGDSGAPF